MQRDVATFTHLSQSHRSKLLSSGYRVAQDLKDVVPSDLAADIGVSMDEALQILKAVRAEVPPLDGSRLQTHSTPLAPSQSAFELLLRDTSRPGIVTFCEALDQMLGGGVPLGKITEFCGAPGIGKTQIGMQLAIMAHIPALFGGVEGECIYVDTEGSFAVDRLVEMAGAVLEHLQAVADSDEKRAALGQLRVNTILDTIYCFRVHDYVQQIAIVNMLASILLQYPKVKLVVFDSITFHFRHDFEDMYRRTRLLNSMAQSLLRVAESSSLAVVVMNQMTTRIEAGGGPSSLVPALGESWGHACTNRVILYWSGSERRAYLAKSPSQRAATAPFAIARAGVISATPIAAPPPPADDLPMS